MRYTKAKKNCLGVKLLVSLIPCVVILGCGDPSEQAGLLGSSKPNESDTLSLDQDDQSRVVTPETITNTQAESLVPKQFSDSIRFIYDAERDWQKLTEQRILVEASPATNVRPDEVSFELVFVPGDVARGIEPFYLSKTEVAAEMFYPWATGIGLGSKEWMQWASLDLRPSRMLWNELGYGPPNRPALGMSRTVAEHYCQWLSRQTGRTYRLPTQAEWEHAVKLGGGVPNSTESLLAQATLKKNHNVLLEPPFLEMPTPVGFRAANKIGLHDMLGNAAEWVADTGKDRVVRGGHFMLKADELTPDWRAVEDVKDWNSSSPWGPKLAHWYTSFPYTGIRLACDAEQAPKQTPEDALEPASEAP